MLTPKQEYKLQKKYLDTIKDRAFYSLRSILGNNWAIFYVLIGARQAGKSYAVMDYLLKQFTTKEAKNYWFRLTDSSAKKLLKNNAAKLIDPDLARKYNVECKVKGNDVYVGKKVFCSVLAVSNFYNDKGNAYYDKDYHGWINIVLDEMNREQNEKNTFDIVYSFVNQVENVARNRKDKIRVFLIGNDLQEASDIMTSFNFLPETFGRYYLRKKRCVVDYYEPTEAYCKMREGSIADLLQPDSSTFTNMVEVDRSLVDKRRLKSVTAVLIFSKNKEDWFAIYDNLVIKRYNGETTKNNIYMRPYLDGPFSVELRDNVYQRYDAQMFRFRDLITQKLFKKQLELLKQRK